LRSIAGGTEGCTCSSRVWSLNPPALPHGEVTGESAERCREPAARPCVRRSYILQGEEAPAIGLERFLRCDPHALRLASGSRDRPQIVAVVRSAPNKKRSYQRSAGKTPAIATMIFPECASLYNTVALKHGSFAGSAKRVNQGQLWCRLDSPAVVWALFCGLPRWEIQTSVTIAVRCNGGFEGNRLINEQLRASPHVTALGAEMYVANCHTGGPVRVSLHRFLPSLPLNARLPVGHCLSNARSGLRGNWRARSNSKVS
jgi:hypothetical protein